jgi:Tfp pilus assembly protein FimT
MDNLGVKDKALTLQADRVRLRSAAPGFATVEVLVAVAVVALIGTVAVLGFGGIDRARLASEAAEVRLFLQEARMRALEGGRPVEIVLSAQEGVLQAGPKRHVFSRGVTVLPDAARVVLQPSGENEGLDLALSRNGETARISVDWLTGKVEVK